MAFEIPKKTTELVFVDVETSSLNPDADILEIAGLIVDENLKIKEDFDFLIKPKDLNKANPKSLEIIGYSEEKWKNAYNLKDVLDILYPKFKNKILTGWLSHFDFARLEKAFYENGFDYPFDYRKIDVFSLAVAKYGLKKISGKETLTKICRILNIDRGKAHSAYDDAYASYKVFLKLIDNKVLEKEKEEIVVYTDGGSLNNPGKAAIGVVIKSKTGVKKFSKEIGIKTNNQAEYEAIIFALEKIKQIYKKDNLKKNKVIINTDSEVVGNQLKGKYKITEEKLFPYFIKFNNLKIDFNEIEINIIDRQENKDADKLVKKILLNKLSTIF